MVIYSLYEQLSNIRVIQNANDSFTNENNPNGTGWNLKNHKRKRKRS